MFQNEEPIQLEEFRNGVMKLVHKLNSFNLNESVKVRFMKLFVGDEQIGHVHHTTAEVLKDYSDLFIFEDQKIVINPIYKTYDEISEAFHKVLLNMKAKGHFKKELDGWRDECYHVRSRFSQKPLFKIERASVSLFGIKSYGCHVNGYIKKDGQYFLWIARRSYQKPTYPGMLDNFTGGGITAGLGVLECAKKELQEEAGVGPELAEKIKSVDAITYATVCPYTVKIEGEFIFDIKLPSDYEPINQDKEVECFYLMNINQVKKAIISDEFKPNSAVVTLNFLFRKGLLTPDELPTYLEILENIHYHGL